MLDGSDYFHSTRLQCPSCLQRHDSSGQVHFRHTVVSGTLVKAGSRRVLPLDVEEVRNEDGHDKQDCELKAAKRLMPRLRHERKAEGQRTQPVTYLVLQLRLDLKEGTG
jgi:hypothetical protein